MSIISNYEVDNSPALAKHFALLARGYLEKRTVEEDESAHVTLENIYRMLEMFRYGSFEDESRKGVLALQDIENKPEFSLEQSSWHAPIEIALEEAVSKTYGSVQKDEAIDELEGSLRWLVLGSKEPADNEKLGRATQFFSTFEALI